MTRLADPTRTSAIRLRYVRAVHGRFDRLRRDVVRSVVEQDAFNLTRGLLLTPRLLDITKPREFDQSTPGGKVEAFKRWLQEQVDKGILEVSERDQAGRIVARKEWQDVFIRAAYREGVRAARRAIGVDEDDQARSLGDAALEAAFNQPIHADRVGLLFLRNFTELQGVTDAMAQAMTRVLADGLSRGLSPREIGRTLAKQVDGIGKARGELIARTEVIRAHAEATLNEFESHGVTGVSVLAEFSTAGDGKVCPRCAKLEGKVYSLSEAHGVIPVHPRCRCSFVPASVGENASDRARRRAQLVRQGFRFPEAA